MSDWYNNYAGTQMPTQQQLLQMLYRNYGGTPSTPNMMAQQQQRQPFPQPPSNLFQRLFNWPQKQPQPNQPNQPNQPDQNNPNNQNQPNMQPNLKMGALGLGMMSGNMPKMNFPNPATNTANYGTLMPNLSKLWGWY